MAQAIKHGFFIALCLLAASSAQPAEEIERSKVDALDGSQEGLNKLLAWSIEHSNLSDLSEQARTTKAGQPDQLSGKRIAELREIMQQMNSEPSDAQLMKAGLEILANASSSRDEMHHALTALRYLVEPIDNAKDFPGLGGIQIVQGIIKNAVDTGLQSEALHVLGTAASNNPDFQEAALKSPHLLSALYESMESNSVELVGKALYALAALIRNSHDGQAQFFATDGVEIVTEMLSRHDAASILRKTLNLLHDIVDSGGYVEGSQKLASRKLATVLVHMMTHPDADIQERILLTLLAFSKRPQLRKELTKIGTLQAVQKTRVKFASFSKDADDEHRETLKEFLVLLADLQDALTEDDRTEL